NGRSADAPYPWTSWSAPEVGERKEIVRSASAPSTSTARTARRTIAFRPLPEKRSDLERRTDEPSTATRAARSRDATGLGYRGSRRGESRPLRMTGPSSGGRCAGGRGGGWSGGWPGSPRGGGPSPRRRKAAG